MHRADKQTAQALHDPARSGKRQTPSGMDEREDPIPDPPFTGGPYLYVAWPGELNKILPLNCSSAIREWEELADPVAASTLLAGDMLGGMAVWTVGERYVVPGPSTQSLVRQTLTDERVEKELAKIVGHAAMGDAARR